MTARSGAELHRRWWIPWLWVTPALAGVTAFGLLPFANTVSLSFTDAKPLGGPVHAVGFANYSTLWHDPDFWTALGNSLLYLAIAVPLLVSLPLLLACLVRPKIPMIGFFRSAYYVPVVASTVVVGLAWQTLLKDDGLVNSTLKKAHLIHQAVPFLSDSTMVLLSAIALTVWKGLGYYMVLYLAALGNVDRSLYEAAELDGASATARFRHVTLPGVRTMTYLVGVLSAIGALRVFAEVYLLGGEDGGPGGQSATLVFYIRSIGLDPLTGNVGLASAASVVLFLLTFGLILASQRFNRRSEEAR
ncbi:putative chitobiose transport system permease protein [Catenulispora sp. MAP12-49]|uniref:carbohydrate ABC transporter permease n=1 Tax=Catenulispora sp. MAP12-49 TaxID=3156302 RepID=UPI003516B782